ncbi:MAG: [Phascolarctobacterium sp.]|nr:[citrate (pro-3S)-lyase] ligase [Phascolarctobacterium sp.]
FALMKQGVADLRNVVVISGGDYIVSNATFPTYFIKGTDELAAQTRLDAMIFAQRIAPELNITARYVGEEPNDKTTMAYNQAMSEILPENGIELYIIPRKEINGEVISASKVRKAVLEGNWEAVASMVPKSTLIYLQSDKGNEIVKRIELMETIKGGIR